MTLVLKLSNHNNLYHRLKTDRILVNEIDIFDNDNKEMMDNLIMKNYSEDNFSIVPSCQCGEIKGGYYVGSTCPTCKTVVSSSTDDAISYLLWLKQPKEVMPFVSPIILTIMVNRYKITKPNIPLIKYIMIPNYVIDRKQQKKNIGLLEKLDFLLAANGITRGYNSFVTNFFKIVDILEAEFVNKKQVEKDSFKKFLHDNVENIFSNYLPFPNKIMFAMESNELGKFIDKSLLNPINVIRRVTGIDLHTRPSMIKQTKIAKSLLDIAEFYQIYMKNNFFKKPGLVRQNVASTRSHYTARGVITSIPGPHDYDEIHMPWSMSCTLFRHHLLNGLSKLGYTYRQQQSYMMYHNRIYSPLIDGIFNEIIKDSGGGVKMFFNRNPSLHRGSIQTVRLTYVKKDIADNTISMSYLIAPSYNADYDGDQMNLTLPLTQKIIKNMTYFEPHHSLLALSGTNDFTNNIKYPKTIVSNLANFYNAACV